MRRKPVPCASLTSSRENRRAGTLSGKTCAVCGIQSRVRDDTLLQNGVDFDQFLRAQCPIGGFRVRLDVGDFRRAGDDGADLWLCQQPGVGEFGHCVFAGFGPGGELLDFVVVRARSYSVWT